MAMPAQNKTVSLVAIVAILLFAIPAIAGPYTETGIYKGNSGLVAWATDCDVVRGLLNISNPSSGYASFGSETNATGQAEGTSTDVVSLGDGGVATLTFDESIYITNDDGNDFAIFENAFTVAGGDDFLELAFVEVSSDGVNFFGFDVVSLTPTNVQAGNSSGLDHTNIHNLAGKHLRGYGTQFDLEELKDVSEILDVNSITHVRIIDVVGFIEPADINGDGIVNFVDYSIFAAAYASESDDDNWNEDCDMHRVWVEDSPSYYEDPDGIINLYDFQLFVENWLSENDYSSCDINGHQINDPWPTLFDSSGFDLDAVGVMNAKPRE